MPTLYLSCCKLAIEDLPISIDFFSNIIIFLLIALPRRWTCAHACTHCALANCWNDSGGAAMVLMSNTMIDRNPRMNSSWWSNRYNLWIAHLYYFKERKLTFLEFTKKNFFFENMEENREKEEILTNVLPSLRKNIKIFKILSGSFSYREHKKTEKKS